MTALDRVRRVRIVKSLSIAFVGLAIAYIVPEILGLIVKLQSGNTEITPWQAAMASIPIRIIHIIGLAMTLIAAISVYVSWAKRFTEARAGEI